MARTARLAVPWLALIGLAAAALIALLVAFPLGLTVVRLFFGEGQLAMTGWNQLMEEPGLGKVLLNTVIFVGASGLIALAIGAVFAWLTERTDAGLGWASDVVPLVPLLLPSLAGTVGWVFLMAPKTGYINIILRYVTGSEEIEGPFNIFSMVGMIFVAAMYLVPYAYLTLAAALRNLDASLEEASRVSGGGIFRTFFRISMPAITPALISAMILILMAGIGLFSIPAVLGTRPETKVLSYLMYVVVEREYPPRIAEAIVLSVMALSVIQVALLAQWLFSGRRFQTMGARGLVRASIPLGVWRTPARIMMIVYVAGAAVLPLGALILVSLQRFWTPNVNWGQLGFYNYAYIFMEKPVVVDALKNSLQLGLAVAVLGMAVATVLSYYVSRRPGILTRMADNVAMLPATIPHIIMGIAFIVAFTPRPFALYGTTTLLFLAYLAIYMPQAMQSSKFAFSQVSPDLMEASRVFGAGELKSFVRIMMPLILPSTLAGMLILAILTMVETNASVILAKVNNPVLGPTLFILWYDGLVPPVAALSVVICAFNGLIALASLYLGRTLSYGR